MKLNEFLDSLNDQLTESINKVEKVARKVFAKFLRDDVDQLDDDLELLDMNDDFDKFQKTITNDPDDKKYDKFFGNCEKTIYKLNKLAIKFVSSGTMTPANAKNEMQKLVLKIAKKEYIDYLEGIIDRLADDFDEVAIETDDGEFAGDCQDAARKIHGQLIKYIKGL